MIYKKIPMTLKVMAAPTVASLFILPQQSVAQGLEEVIVTAQKRAENLQEVPVSVSTLAGSDIEMLRFRDGADITAQIPNLQATNTMGDGFPIFSLRGVAMSDFSLNQASPVATYVDEVYKGNPAIQGKQIFDLERIEVLRGPQGTLYGKNSTGGAVNFVTRKPGYDETSGNLALGIGNYGRKEVSGAIETPITDNLAVRLAGEWIEADGWFENKVTGLDDGNAVAEWGGRLTVAWQPTDSLEAILRYTKTDQEAVNYGIQAFNISEAGVGGGLYTLYNALGASDVADYYREGLDFWEFESDQDRERTLATDSLALTINWDLSDSYTLTSITSWDDGEMFNPEDVEGSPRVVLRSDFEGEATQYTQDLRLTSELDGAFNFIAGVYWAREEVDNATNIGFYQDVDMNADGSLDFLDCADVVSTAFTGSPVTDSGMAVEGVLNSLGLSLATFAPAGCQAYNEFEQERNSSALYFDGNYALSDAWTVRLGLRHTNDETELSGFTARLLGSDGIPLFNTIPGSDDPFAVVPDQEEDHKEWTGKVGVDYLDENGMLVYASYSRGYRSGAFNAQAFLDPSEFSYVDPETLDGFEVGIKHEMMDGRLRLNAAAFYYTYEDQQFLNVDAETLAQTLISIDESEILGAEIELDMAVTDNLTLQAGLGLLDTEVKEGALSGVDLEGNELLLAPDMNFNLAFTWEIAETDLGIFSLRGNSTFVDDLYFDVFNTDRIASDGYWVLNARLDLVSQDDKWQLGGWVKNLADEEYYTSTLDLQSFGYDYAHVGAPRTYGAELRYNF